MTNEVGPTRNKQISLFDASAEQIKTALEAAHVWAQSQVVPARYHKRPADILVAVEMGRRYNLAPFDALRSIYTIEGTASLSAALVYGLCRAHPAWAGLDEDVLKNESGDVVGYQFTAHRKGAKPITRWYTISDAEKAGLVNRNNWERMQRRMLLVRARHYALCDQYPDVVLGVTVVDVSEDGTLDNMNDATARIETKPAEKQGIAGAPTTVKDLAKEKAREAGVEVQPVEPKKLSNEKVEQILGEFHKLGITEEDVAAMMGRRVDEWDEHDLPNLREKIKKAKQGTTDETETKSR